MSTLIEKLEKRLKKIQKSLKNGVDSDQIIALHSHESGFLTAFNIVKQHSDWISVDERLPKPKQEVLIDVGGKTRIAIFLGKAEDGDELLFDYDFTEDEKFAYQYFCDTSHQVTHWQPLPQQPSEVQP